jgi:metal-responsive CopG/Arc/MetJ family transcriptional regulator
MPAKPKKRGRPATGVDPLYGVRIPDTLILAVDRWAAENDAPSRSDAMRRLLELGLSFSKKPPKVKH